MIEIEPVGTLVSKWGEGPVWWNDCLYYVDIEGHTICRFQPDTGKETSWNLAQRIGVVVPRASGGFVFGGDQGLFFLDEMTGKTLAIVDPEPDKPDNRFNDGKCSPDGRFFAGTISLIKKTGDAKLYRLDPDHGLHEVFAPVTNSNGMAWSTDGKTLYYIDTPRKEVLAFDYASGELSNQKSVISTKHLEASPDGMTIDTDGNLWIAFCHGACVACFDPRSGQELRKIELPCLETTSCAFGGPDLSHLYVTTGIHKTEIEKNAGHLFRIRGLGVKGLATNAFVG